jgi:hypothetical protein
MLTRLLLPSSSPLFPERGKKFGGKLISAPSGTDWQHNIPIEFVGLYWILHINLQVINCFEVASSAEYSPTVMMH